MKFSLRKCSSGLHNKRPTFQIQSFRFQYNFLSFLTSPRFQPRFRQHEELCQSMRTESQEASSRGSSGSATTKPFLFPLSISQNFSSLISSANSLPTQLVTKELSECKRVKSKISFLEATYAGFPKIIKSDHGKPRLPHNLRWSHQSTQSSKFTNTILRGRETVTVVL